MPSNQMSPIQQRLLKMMGWYHDFCTRHQLRYFAIGGTMLGAARHQGFIPWDDDLDVGMPRPDYERFCALMTGTNDHPPYVVETIHMNRPDFDISYAKVYDTTTTLIENNRKHSKRGLFIDIYPLDGIGPDLKTARRSYVPIYLRLSLLVTRICELRKGRSPLKNGAILLARLIPGCFYNEQKALQVIDRCCAARSYDESAIVGNLMGMRRFKELMPREWFGEAVDYAFEDIVIRGVARPEEYLTQLYGDWRQLPPADQQQTTHGFVSLDLNKSYLEEET